MFEQGNSFSRISLDGIKIISTDVFDTLLLRKSQSQRSRLFAAEVAFSRRLAAAGHETDVERLIKARRASERFAYQALNIGGGNGEVRLTDLISRQLQILNLPQRFVDERVAIELSIEKQALVANGWLAMWLRHQRSRGLRVIAVSDTALEQPDLSALIDYFHGPGLIDRVLSSATCQSTKRFGGLFNRLLLDESVNPSEVLHIGDDAIADAAVPSRLGLRVNHLPRGPLARLGSTASGASTETKRFIGRALTRPRRSTEAPNEHVAFGHDVFGPIVAQFCLYIWLYAEQAQADGKTRLLFCARGGIGIHKAFERVIASLGLPLAMPRGDLLISRLVAARAAIIKQSPAALDELGREFKGASFADVASALGGGSYDLASPWQEQFDPAQFYAMLHATDARAVLDDITRQNDLFREHLDELAGDAERLILCDTGLYGSTLRLLAAGLPERNLEAVHFARSNYKGFDQEHFAKLAGLVVERNLYHPLQRESVVLRYWQIVEALFEPDIPSVRLFGRDASGAVISNAGNASSEDLADDSFHPLMIGALQYIDSIRSGDTVFRDAEKAWTRLKKAIINPSRSELVFLNVGHRSVDFGRGGYADLFTTSKTASFQSKLTSIKSNLWREGAIAKNFSLSRPALLLLLEASHIVRGITASRS